MAEKLSKRERVEAALQGEPVDRVPVSAWQHFIPAETQTGTLAQASLHYFKTFDWDWLKVNPRATYYAEAWGNRYNYSNYDRVYPRLEHGPLNGPGELAQIREVDPGQGVFAEQVDLARQIKAGLGGAHFVYTVFSPLSVLGFLAARPKVHSADAVVQAHAQGVARYIRENPVATHAALAAIAATLGRYAARLIDAGASGLFFALVKMARQGVLTRDEYDAFGKPYDLQVLQAVQGAPFNLLHICGPSVYFDLVADYPVQAINWASVGQGNPSVGEAMHRTRLAIVGGVDEDGVLQTGAPEDVIQEATAAIRATQGYKFLLAPGCATSMHVPAANLHALRVAAGS